MRNKKVSITVALAILFIAYTITFTGAQSSPEEVEVPRLQVAVTLDGVITGGEWSDASRMDVMFAGDGLTHQGTVYLKHDCEYF